jgi:hypothetical protein
LSLYFPCLSLAPFVYISFLPLTFSLLLSPSFFMAFLTIHHQNMVLWFPAIVKSVTEFQKKFSARKEHQ